MCSFGRRRTMAVRRDELYKYRSCSALPPEFEIECWTHEPWALEHPEACTQGNPISLSEEYLPHAFPPSPLHSWVSGNSTDTARTASCLMCMICQNVYNAPHSLLPLPITFAVTIFKSRSTTFIATCNAHETALIALC